MNRQYYLRGKLHTVDAVDDVVAVKGVRDEIRPLLSSVSHAVEHARATVRDIAPAVDESALEALQRAGWEIHPASDQLRAARRAGEAPPVAADVGTLIVGRDGAPAIATDLLTAQLSGEPSATETDAILEDAGLVRVNTLHFAPHLYEVRTASGDALAASVALHDDPRFVFVEPALVEYVPGRFTPGDPRFGDQWQWANSGADGGTAGADVHAEEAWDHTLGAGIRVAVIDNGFDAGHEDLAAGVGPASGFYRSWVDGPATFTASVADMPDGDHGTFCAGMVGARQGNGVGGVGAAPEAELTLIAALGDQVGTQATLARAVAYAANPATEPDVPANPGADIIVSSLGPNSAEWLLTSVLDLALQTAARNGRDGRGCAIFWAASNASNVDVLQDEVSSHPDVIAVVRSTRNDLEDDAARGSEVELIAPGVDVFSTSSGNAYSTSTGTSFAAPCAAGVAALALSVHPEMTRDQLRALMRDTADKVGGVVYDAAGHNDDYGFGRVNAAAAVTAAQQQAGAAPNAAAAADVPEPAASGHAR